MAIQTQGLGKLSSGDPRIDSRNPASFCRNLDFVSDASKGGFLLFALLGISDEAIKT